MKHTFLMAILLSACGTQGAKVFTVSADADDTDRTNIEIAMKGINDHLGCTMVAHTDSHQVFVVDQNLPWPTSVIGFTDQKGNEADIEDLSSKNKKHVGGAYFSYSDSIVYTSWKQFQKELKGANWTPEQVKDAFLRLGIHELGHSLGLEHSKGEDDIMYADGGNTPVTEDVWSTFVQQLDAIGVRCPADAALAVTTNVSR